MDVVDGVTPREVDESSRVVVCNLEGARHDANAVEVARQLAVVARARLALVAVAAVQVPGAFDVPPTWTPEQARAALELTAATVDGAVDVDCYLEIGNPVRRLTEFARDTRALLLVVGTSTDAADRPASLSARGVARSAPCPVVVVPESAAVPALVA